MIHGAITNKKFADGLESLTNNLANRRNVTHTNAITSVRLTGEAKNEIFKTGLGNKIVRLKIDSAYKEGLSLEDEQEQKVFDDKLLRRVREASKWMLSFGRGIVCLVEPDKDVKEPLSANVNLETLMIRVFDGSMVTAQNASYDLKNPRYYKPRYYQVRGNSFHWSRVIDFRYVLPREYDLPTYQFGGISEYELIYTQLINDGVVERAAPVTLEKNSTVFYKLEGFKDALRAGTEDNLLKYFQLLEDYRGAYSSGILDGGDSVETVNQTLTNLSETDTITLRRIAMVTGIPLSELVGENVQGLNANGDNEKVTYNATISSLQNNYLIEPINEMLKRLGMGNAEFNSAEEISQEEELTNETRIIENALKLEEMGLSGADYLKKYNLEVKDSLDLFAEDDNQEVE